MDVSTCPPRHKSVKLPEVYKVIFSFFCYACDELLFKFITGKKDFRLWFWNNFFQIQAM